MGSGIHLYSHRKHATILIMNQHVKADCLRAQDLVNYVLTGISNMPFPFLILINNYVCIAFHYIRLFEIPIQLTGHMMKQGNNFIFLFHLELIENIAFTISSEGPLKLIKFQRYL